MEKAMIKTYLKALTATMLFFVIVGCQMPRLKQLEQENSELRSAMKEKEELLAQTQTKVDKQAQTVTACQEKITSQQKRIDDIELMKFEIGKKLDLCQIQLKKQTDESTRLTGIIETYQKQIKELNDQLGSARQAISALQNQIKTVTGAAENKTSPAGTTTQPAGK
jgi:chromosome segregation ATPase